MGEARKRLAEQVWTFVNYERFGLFAALDAAKGFSQMLLSKRLYPYAAWVYEHLVVSPTRLFLGLNWAPSWFSSYTSSTYRTLRVPENLVIEDLMHISVLEDDYPSAEDYVTPIGVAGSACRKK